MQTSYMFLCLSQLFHCIPPPSVPVSECVCVDMCMWIGSAFAITLGQYKWTMWKTILYCFGPTHLVDQLWASHLHVVVIMHCHVFGLLGTLQKYCGSLLSIVVILCGGCQYHAGSILYVFFGPTHLVDQLWASHLWLLSYIAMFWFVGHIAEVLWIIGLNCCDFMWWLPIPCRKHIVNTTNHMQVPIQIPMFFCP